MIHLSDSYPDILLHEASIIRLWSIDWAVLSYQVSNTFMGLGITTGTQNAFIGSSANYYTNNSSYNIFIGLLVQE
jgi:hypothetical protein